jgi:hypothetical protein
MEANNASKNSTVMESISTFPLISKQFKHTPHSTNQLSQTSIQIIMPNFMSIVTNHLPTNNSNAPTLDNLQDIQALDFEQFEQQGKCP